MTRELKLRIVSAIVLAPLVLLATWQGGIYFRLLSALIGLLIFYEWSTMTGLAASRFGFVFGWAATALIMFETAFRSIETALVLLLGFSLTALILALLRRSSWWLPGGVFYAGLSGVSLAALRGGDRDGLITMLFLFAVVWATDIFAYFIGRAIGGPKLAPAISPGKTWSGAIGGAILAIVAGYGVIAAAGETVSLWLAPIILALSAASQCGDLFESWVKRRSGVKDSSRLIPGHGGVMDRADGLVAACFLAFIGGLALSVVNGGWMADAGKLVTGP
ncbi:phosphatidate cytidylyltransferase [Rhizobium sp. SG_E_25_P2]|jgi:phosphatidate cytidylyltransferase|uniref:phosphatidate cytidylyltransferase n=1 Tax=Rhizobium sp. SG_E_25_P2 TaxID=2879942 RepID=UPI00247643CA|nr:phosphatidate cytidylyltransferase [Rhizobium sp. SG_E_25_P2]MDH6267945.1 phosphatidate cytidylyltransferase [Rhizobium sp. SG_E_25_P2]